MYKQDILNTYQIILKLIFLHVDVIVACVGICDTLTNNVGT